MLHRWGRAALLGCVAIVIASCASSTPFLSVARDKPVRLSVVQQALTKTLRNTGAFAETLSFSAGSGQALTVNKAGSFDSPRGRLQMTVQFASSDPTAQANEAEVRLRLFGDVMYMQMPAWHDSRRGKWLKFTRASLSRVAAQQGLDISPTAAGHFVPSNLLGVITDARSAVSSANAGGYVTYRLTVASSDAVYALGNSAVKTLLTSGHDVTELTGYVMVTVEQTPGGTIDLVKMDGTRLVRQLYKLSGSAAQVPSSFEAVSTLRIFDLGRPFTTPEPRGSQIWRK